MHDLVENVRSAQPGGITGDMEGKSVEGHWRRTLDGPRSLRKMDIRVVVIWRVIGSS